MNLVNPVVPNIRCAFFLSYLKRPSIFCKALSYLVLDRLDETVDVSFLCQLSAYARRNTVIEFIVHFMALSNLFLSISLSSTDYSLRLLGLLWCRWHTNRDIQYDVIDRYENLTHFKSLSKKLWLPIDIFSMPIYYAISHSVSLTCVPLFFSLRVSIIIP